MVQRQHVTILLWRHPLARPFPAKKIMVFTWLAPHSYQQKINMFGLRKFNTPVLRPMAPFFIGAATVIYLIGKAQVAMIDSK